MRSFFWLWDSHGGHFDSNCSVSSKDFALPTTITVFLLWNYHGIFTIELFPSFALQSFQYHNPSNANLFLPLFRWRSVLPLSAGCVLSTGSEPKKSPGVDLPNVSVRDCNLSNNSALVASLLSVEIFAREAPLWDPEDDTVCFFLLFPLLLDFFPIVDAQILFNVQGEEVYIMFVWVYWMIQLKVSKHQSNDLTLSCGGKCQIFFCF